MENGKGLAHEAVSTSDTDAGLIHDVTDTKWLCSGPCFRGCQTSLLFKLDTKSTVFSFLFLFFFVLLPTLLTGPKMLLRSGCPLSPFLIGCLLCVHSSGYSSNLVGFWLGELLLREPSWENSLKCDEAIFGVQKASLNMFAQFGEHCLWLVESKELSCGWGRIFLFLNGWRCGYFTRFGGNWPICWLVGGAALSLRSRMI